MGTDAFRAFFGFSGPFQSRPPGIQMKLTNAIVCMKDPANLHIMDNRHLTSTIKMAYFTVTKNANWACDRALRSAAFPLGTLEFECSRAAFRAEIGDLYRIVCPELSVDSIFRIIGLNEDSPTSEAIKISAMEDPNYLGHTLGELEYTGYEEIDNDTTLDTLSILYVMEAPYAISGDSIQLASLVSRITGNETGYQTNIAETSIGDSYTALSTETTFNQFGRLSTAYTDDTYEIDDEIGFTIETTPFDWDQIISISRESLFTHANLAVIFTVSTRTGFDWDEEIISFQTITPTAENTYKIENIVRGRYDTQKFSWPIGANFMFIGDAGYGPIESTFFAGTKYLFKFLAYNISELTPIDEALEYRYTPYGRAYKPLEPANVMINNDGTYFYYEASGDIIISWTPRVRASGAGTQPRNATPISTGHEGYFYIFIYMFNGINWISDEVSIPEDDTTYTFNYSKDLRWAKTNFIDPISIEIYLYNSMVAPDGATYSSTTTKRIVRLIS